MYLGKEEVLETMHKLMDDFCPWDSPEDTDHIERMAYWIDGIHAMTVALLERMDEEKRKSDERTAAYLAAQKEREAKNE